MFIAHGLLWEKRRWRRKRAHTFGRCELALDSTYSFDKFAVPEYRVLGIGPYVFNEALDYLNKRQVNRLYALVDKANWLGIRAVEKEGYRLVGEIILRKIFKYRIIRYEAKTVEDHQTTKKMRAHSVVASSLGRKELNFNPKPKCTRALLRLGFIKRFCQRFLQL